METVILTRDTETPEARYARRRADPISHSVAVWQAAQAYATWQGWDWPSLSDFYGIGAEADVLALPAAVLELRRIEMRQRVLEMARVMCDEYSRHLQIGGSDAAIERHRAAMIREQHEQDTTRRLLLKPKPLSSILAPRTGD